MRQLRSQARSKEDDMTKVKTSVFLERLLASPRFKCMECGKKFRTVKAAERASFNGCPGCGGLDVDVDVDA